MQPDILTHSKFNELNARQPGITVINEIELAFAELFDIAYPHKKDTKGQAEVADYVQTLAGADVDEWGSWVYYPWLNTVVHMPPMAELRALRTSRNRNLVTAEEQHRLYQATILVAGMSVGSNVVEALVSQGIGGELVLVDMDIIEPSNLNRIRAPYHHVGLHKVEAISRKVWEIDPYIKITGYRDGLSEENIEKILQASPVDIIVDEVDDLRMKVLIREAAKARSLPVVMAADDGDDALVDIERFDTDPQSQPFDGSIPQAVLDQIKAGDIPRQELGIMIGRYFVGAENIPLRMYQSLMEVGKSLPSWPQLGGAAALSGVALSYACKKIILGQGLRTGRTLVSLDGQLGGGSLSESDQQSLAQFQSMMRGES